MMSDKLARAKHARVPSQHSSSKRTEGPADSTQDLSTQALPSQDFSAQDLPTPDRSTQDLSLDSTILEPDNPDLDESEPEAPNIGSSAVLISICTIISRITGFARTWAMAFALGSTMLSSAYQVANNLPNMLYELVIGGMLVTAFLPVYLSVKKSLGEKAGNDYASNLLTLVIISLGIVSVICIIFPAQIIYTQSFFSDQSDMATATFFFRIFAIELVFYGLSSLLSGLLNASRDYFWSSIAPVANNVVVIATFIVFPFLSEVNYTLALYVIAVGKPFAVFVQFIMQWPALKRNGIRLRWHVNLHDPALRETLRIGLPTIFVMLCSFVVVSVQNAASYSFSEDGPSVIAYARLWYTFPYSFLAVPITTAMFTELSEMHADGNIKQLKAGIISGSNQILFLMIPFAMYLIVFATPLVTLYHAGAFTLDAVGSISNYLIALALSLPLYGVNTYLQKIFSSIRRMGVFSIINFFTSGMQVVLVILAALSHSLPIESIAWTSIAFYGLGDLAMFIYLRAHYGSFNFTSLVRICIVGTVLGFIGAFLGNLVLKGLEWWFPVNGSIIQAFIFIVIGGIVALLGTFLPAALLKIPEAAPLTSLVGKVRRVLLRRS